MKETRVRWIWSKNLLTNLHRDALDPDVDVITLLAGEEYEIREKFSKLEEFQVLEEFARNKTLNIVLGCYETEQHTASTEFPPSANVYYWPTLWINRTISEIEGRGHWPKKLPLTKLFLSLNTKPRPHRCLLMDTLAKKDLLKQGELSWQIVTKEYDFKYWKPEELILDKEYQKTLDQYTSLPDGFSTTFMSIVPETSEKIQFITEKTMMPIFYKRPFLIFGAPGMHQRLEELGFELYTELFDYSFDSVEDDTERCELLLENLERIKNNKLKKMKKALQPKLKRNFDRAMEIASDPSYVPEVVLKVLKENPEILKVGYQGIYNRLIFE